MSSTTWIMLVSSVVLITLDIFIPSGGLLAGTGIALIIERLLDSAGVIAAVRWPLAGLGMVATIALAVRYGEQLSEKLFPAQTKTNIDRLIGTEARVKRSTTDGIVVEIEGDLWTARVATGVMVEPGDRVVVTAIIDQVLIVTPARNQVEN